MADEKVEKQAESRPGKPAAKGNTDKRVKLAFLAVVLALVGWLVYRQYMGPQPPGAWEGDLAKALAQGEREGRPVLAVIYTRPPSEDYKQMVAITLSKRHNITLMDEMKVIRVLTTLKDTDALAQKYEVKKRPTSLMIGPDGSLLARREGYVGELDFKSLLAGE